MCAILYPVCSLENDGVAIKKENLMFDIQNLFLNSRASVYGIHASMQWLLFLFLFWLRELFKQPAWCFALQKP